MRGPGKVSSQRRQRLLDQIEGRGSVRVSELAAALQVSELTIRRDLDELCGDGLVERFHGGAQIAHAGRRESPFADKALQHAAEKDAIGAQAAALAKTDDTVLVNGGSTTLAAMRHLRRRRVRIVTNNAAVAADGADATGEIILLGGALRPGSRSLVGDLALLTLSQIHASLCILGANGVSARTGLTTSVYAETAINRLMAERCDGNLAVVADGSKIGVTSNFAGVPLAQVRILITGPSADRQELDAIRAAGVQVIVASGDDARPEAAP